MAPVMPSKIQYRNLKFKSSPSSLLQILKAILDRDRAERFGRYRENHSFLGIFMLLLLDEEKVTNKLLLLPQDRGTHDPIPLPIPMSISIDKPGKRTSAMQCFLRLCSISNVTERHIRESSVRLLICSPKRP